MKRDIVLFMPSIDKGGVEKNFFLISNYLANYNSKIKVITISKKFKNRFNRKIEFISLKWNFWDKLTRRIKFSLALILLIIEILRNKDLLVISFQANMYCAYLSKLFGFKLIIRSNSSPYGWSQNFFKKKLYKLGFTFAEGIIVNSIAFKKQIENLFKVKAKHIYNPLNSSEIIKLSKKRIKFKFFRKGYLNIISVGRLVDQKDHLTLLKSLNSIKYKINFKLLIIGDGYNKLNILNYIKNNKLNSNVKLLTDISNPFPYILKADILVLSSVFEGLPNVLLEALTLKKFIISTNCPTGPSEILNNGKGGILVPVKDHVKLSKKIIFYKENSKILKNKVHYARKNLKRFDKDNVLKEYKKFIDLYLHK